MTVSNALEPPRKRESPFDTFPIEMFEFITKNLSTWNKLRLSRVCSTFHIIIFTSHIIGKTSFEEYGMKWEKIILPLLPKAATTLRDSDFAISDPVAPEIEWPKFIPRFLSTKESVLCLDLSKSMEAVADRINKYTQIEIGIWYLCKMISEIPHLKTFGVTCMAFNEGVGLKKVYSVEEAEEFYMQYPIINQNNFEMIFEECKRIEASNAEMKRISSLNFTLFSDFDLEPLNANAIFDRNKVHHMAFNFVRMGDTRSSFYFQKAFRDHFILTKYYQERNNFKKRSSLFVRAFNVGPIPVDEPPLKRRKLQA